MHNRRSTILWACLLAGALASLTALYALPRRSAFRQETIEKEVPVSRPHGSERKFTNRLARETSPYLLQHQHNPVDWYAWGEEAFEKARREQKPIFLSVGYSACHWCHVMERECFEDEEVAQQLNEHFVAIKVDREERPDVDDIYMKYIHLTRQSGGWPMSVVLTPEGVPFFGGTYFPKAPFMRLLGRLGQTWQEKKAEIAKEAPKIVGAMQEAAGAEYRPPERPLSAETLTRAVEMLERHIDRREGGLQGERKFPPHTTLEMLVEVVDKKPESKAAREMLKLTLDKMQRGGIHDHIGGGFHRYATDSIWFLPHFEKMLYDNAQTARYYARASVVLKDASYARTARDTFEWVLRDMRSDAGAFFSALDADSEGEEGKFYVWKKSELDAVLGKDSSRFCAIFNCTEEGNYSAEATGHSTGANIPHLTGTPEELAEALKADPAVLRAQMVAWCLKLREVRGRRVWPHRDDKILTAWNALMLGSLAQGGRWLKEPRYVQAAVRAAEWLLANQRDAQGRWLATHRQGQSRLAAYLDDHAYLAQAFLDLHEATGEARWKEEAAAVVKLMNAHFWDEKRGGYFFVADDHEKLLVRVKNPSDNATPSGNGIAAQVLVRLARLTGDKSYSARAAQIFKAFHTLLDLAPIQVESLLLALHEHLAGGGEAAGTTSTATPKVLSRMQKGPVSVELFAGYDKLRAGAKTPLAVRLSMDKGYHVQAHQPAGAGLIPTSLRLVSKELGRLAGEKYPEPRKLPAPELGGELLVYSGETVLGGFLEIPAQAKPGPQVLKVEVEFQACNDKACLAPETVELALPVEIVEARAAVVERNAEVFRALGLER